jgi:tetratricopeptide (TPR) repeat protein
MRKINAKVLLGLLLGSLFATGAVFGIHRFQYDRIADSLLWQARRAEEQGQVKKQARYLQRYLEFHNKDLEQKARLAELWSGEDFAEAPKLRSRAVHLLDDVLAQGEDKPELRRLLVKLALEVKQFKMARNHLEKMLTRDFLESPPNVEAASEQTPQPQRGEVSGYAGQLLESENQLAGAQRCYLLALHHAPKVENNYLLLALLLRRQDQLEPDRIQENRREADRAIDRMVANNPQSSEALLSRWNYRREFGLIRIYDDNSNNLVSLSEAARDVEEALRLSPESLEALLAAADMERFQARVVLAGKETQEVKEKLRTQHRDKALEHLERGLTLHRKKEQPSGIDAIGFRLLWHKANLLLDDREWLEGDDEAEVKEEAEHWRDWTAKVTRVLEEIRATRGSRSAIDFLQARLLLLQHHWADSVALLEQVRPALSSQRDLTAQLNRCLGKGYEQLGEAGPMFDAYQRLLDGDPHSTIARIGMARAEWMMGHLDKASQQFHRLHASGAMPSKLYLDFTRLEILRQSQEQRPDWVNLEKLMDLTEKQNPKSVEIPLLRAQLSLARDGKTDMASNVLRDAQNEKGGDKRVELWIARIQLELIEGNKNVEAARALLNKAKKHLGERVVPLRLAEARILAEEKGKEAEKLIERLADDVVQFPNDDDKAHLLGGLADIQMGLENLASARRLWQQTAQLPNKRTDLPVHLLLFDLASKAEDEDGIRQALDAVRELEGDKGPYHRYGEALRLIAKARKENDETRQKSLEEAAAHLERVRVLRPKWPALFLARAQIERLAGRDDGAIHNLRLARENGESSPAVVRELVELLANAGRYDEADAELKNLRSSLLVHSDLGRIAASVAAQRKDTERARKLFELNRGNEGEGDFRQLLWDGRMLAQTNQPKEAEEKLRAALKAAPREAEPYVALVQFLVRQKRNDEAEPILEQARKTLAADDLELTLGHCHDLLGQKEKARKCYETALQGHRQSAAVVRRVAGFYLNSSLLSATEPLLREIVDKRVRNASTDDVNWARWHLALVLAGGNDYRRFHEALALVGLKLDDKGKLLVDAARQRADSSEQRRFQARVLASQAGQQSFRKYAVELFEELDRNKALPPEDRFILSMLYEADNDWDKAKPLLRELVEPKDPAPRYLAYYVQLLLDHKELRGAEKELKRLEALEKQRAAEPNAFAAIELRARLLEEQQHGNQAIELLEEHLKRPNAHPDEVLLVVNSMSRQKKFGRALDRCLKAWEQGKCAPEVIGGVSVAVLREMQTNDPATMDQVSAIEERLQTAMQSQPKNVVLMLHLAELHDLRGRWKDAETMYRRVLEPDHEPKNIVALNNLAWLLSQHANEPQKHQEALTLIDEAIRCIGPRADLMDTRGLVYMKLGRHSEALADFRDAVANMPTATNLFHLAYAHYKASDKNNALKILKQAQEQGLQASLLHPSEQDNYEKLRLELKIR